MHSGETDHEQLVHHDQAPAPSASSSALRNVDPPDFTSDHSKLLTILTSELQPEGPTPLWNAIYVGITALLHQQGRRVILVFTDGMDSPASSPVNSLKSVMKRAEEEDVMVYAIGLNPTDPYAGAQTSQSRCVRMRSGASSRSVASSSV